MRAAAKDLKDLIAKNRGSILNASSHALGENEADEVVELDETAFDTTN